LSLEAIDDEDAAGVLILVLEVGADELELLDVIGVLGVSGTVGVVGVVGVEEFLLYQKTTA
jgi:hypothetical protein